MLRYCLLYIYGGVYLDIKTELISHIKDIFIDKPDNFIYSCLSKHNDTIYQGIIASTPQNKIFLKLIEYIINAPLSEIDNDYHIFTSDFYNKIKEDTNDIISGYNKGKISDYYLFTEKCSHDSNDCYDGLDRYGYCCYVYNDNNKIIKIRYSDYPWK